jgi:xanthine dehydrogenase accessory factor
MHRRTLQAINAACLAGRAVVRAVELSRGQEHLIDPATDKTPLGQAAAAAARADRSATTTIDGHDWFLSVFNPPLDLVIVGAVHIAQPLAEMAALCGYAVRIIDPRTAFATAERFPGLHISHAWPDEALADAPLGFRSALVALTHDPKLDDPALTTALASPCFYVGALGSKRTHAARLARLREHGLDEDQLSRIHGPIGLAIGAVSPAEIAVSIMAQMTECLRVTAAQGKPAAAVPG